MVDLDDPIVKVIDMSSLPNTYHKISRHLPKVRGFISQFVISQRHFHLPKSGSHDINEQLLKVTIDT